MDIDIKIGNNKVLANGSIITLIKEPLIFNILGLEFKFLLEDDGEPTSRITTTTNNNKTLDIHLINFNNSQGTGPSKPMIVGNHQGKSIYLTFTVYTLINNSTNKLINYTWYLGEAPGGQDGK